MAFILHHYNGEVVSQKQGRGTYYLISSDNGETLWVTKTMLTAQIKNCKNAIPGINNTFIVFDRINKSTDFRQIEGFLPSLSNLPPLPTAQKSTQASTSPRKPKRTALQVAQHKEGIRRLKATGVMRECVTALRDGNVWASTRQNGMGILYELDQNQKKLVADAEKEYDCYVYHVVHTVLQGIGVVTAMFYVSKNQEEWVTKLLQ